VEESDTDHGNEGNLKFEKSHAMLDFLQNCALSLLSQIFTPPSLFAINNINLTYGEVMRGVKREAFITKAVFFGVIALASVGLARKAIAKF